MRFPATIRLDGSDDRVYEPAASAGEWAVSGAFAFADLPPDALIGKQRRAFLSGFLGTESFGWSTLVVVKEISEEAFESVVCALADHFVARYGAPGRMSAMPAARAEAEFAASLCEHPLGTLLGVARAVEDGRIVERFRTVAPQRLPTEHDRVWEIAADDAG